MNIGTLTAQEILILVIGVVAAIMIIGFLFKAFMRLAIVAAMIILIFGVGFGWLPQKMEEIRNGTTTPGEVVNNLIPSNQIMNDAGNTYNQIVNTVTDPVIQKNIFDTIGSLWNKLIAMFNPPVANILNDTTNTIDNTSNTVDNTTNQ